MGHRLSKIYTRTGDDGTTGLGDGSRAPKDSLRVAAFGTVDELNSVIGMMRAEQIPNDVDERLKRIQHELFDLGGELCVPDRAVIDADDVTRLERDLDRFNETLKPLKEFILPGGGRAGAVCHLARAVCRRVERDMVGLSREEPVNENSLKYVNRLSDFLFVTARVLSRESGAGEVLWEHQHRKPAR